MKKILIVLCAIVVFAGLAVINVSNAAAAPAEKAGGPYTGAFNGVIHGDRGSSAPLTLMLNQNGDVVTGTVFLGRGLYVEGGICGAGSVPAGTQTVSGAINRNNQLTARMPLEVSGYNVTISLVGELNSSGTLLDAEAKIDLPWLCGSDPILPGSLQRISR